MKWLGATINGTFEERVARKKKQDWDNSVKALETYVDHYGSITFDDGLDCQVCLDSGFTVDAQSEVIYGS